MQAPSRGESATETGTVTIREWLGERDPSHNDVVSANERLDATFLLAFKRSLAAHHTAASMETLLHTSLSSLHSTSTNRPTYPLAMLREYPVLPTQEALNRQCHEFNEYYRSTVLLGHFPIVALERETVMPLRLGMACIASVCQNDFEQAATLFSAGASLWPVIIEMDNRKARSLEMLYAAVLLIPFGLMAPNETHLAKATLLLSGALTVRAMIQARNSISRRMKLQSPEQSDNVLCHQVSAYSPLLWSLWLWDIVNALHSNGVLQVSSSEILSAIPPSEKPFQKAYAELLEGADDAFTRVTGSEPTNTCRDLTVLLLLAILSDAITLNRSLESSAEDTSRSETRSNRHNPFVPFTAHSERRKMRARLNLALDRWHSNYFPGSDPEVLALYQYCRLFLTYPLCLNLKEMADNSIANPTPLLSRVDLQEVLPSELSVNIAWSILDRAAQIPSDSRNHCKVWMPVVTFHAALTVWARFYITQSSGDSYRASGGAITLAVFKGELETMSWPCCVEMTNFLNRLIITEMASQGNGMDRVLA